MLILLLLKYKILFTNMHCGRRFVEQNVNYTIETLLFLYSSFVENPFILAECREIKSWFMHNNSYKNVINIAKS